MRRAIVFLLLVFLLVPATAKMRMALLSGPPPAAAAFYARLSKQPSALKVSQYNTLFKCAPAQIAKLDALYIFSTNAASGVQADSQTIAFTNLVSSSFVITKQGSGSFAQGVGYQNNGGASDYLDTSFVPSTANGKYALNSASMGVVINNNRLVAQAWAAMGTSGGTTIFDFILPYWSDSHIYSSVEATTNGNIANSTGSAGTWVASRTASNLTTTYQNGSSIFTSNVVSIGLASNSMLIAASRGNAGAIQNNSNDIISAVFFGGGLTSSDVATLTTCLAPITTQSMPFQASLNGFSNNTINDTFADGLAGIDVNNTKAAGFRWYVAPYFSSNAAAAVPAAGDFTYSGGALHIQSSTKASTYRARLHRRGNTSSYFQGTISETTLTVNSLATGSNAILAGQVLAGASVTANSVIQPFGTSGTTGTGGAGTYALSQSSTIGVAQSIVGQSSVGNGTISAGGYFECTMSFNQALTTGDQVGGWPACWMQDLGGLYAQNTTATYGTALEFAEMDFLEAFPSAASSVSLLRNVHDWTNTNGGGFGTNNQNPNNSGTGTGANVMHVYGTLWLTTTKNGGTGLIQRYVDGIHVTGLDQNYFSGAIGSPAFTPSNPSGVFFISESDQYVFMIEGGFEMPGNYANVQAWQ